MMRGKITGEVVRTEGDGPLRFNATIGGQQVVIDRFGSIDRKASSYFADIDEAEKIVQSIEARCEPFDPHAKPRAIRIQPGEHIGLYDADITEIHRTERRNC